MAIGQSGKPVSTSVPGRKPGSLPISQHVHKGSAEATVGGPGPTSASGSNLSGSSGASPYGTK